jgi:UDP-N-acetylglucosamine transferase subunit ALG13
LIFITTGTSLPHDELIRKIDDLKAMGQIRDIIYAQIGNGKYIPNHMKWVKFCGNMEDVYKMADIIISNCGAGTIMENVQKGNRLIVVQNPGITGGHEWELVSKMEKLGCLIWCKDINNILKCIEEARIKKFNKFVPDKFDISLITDLLKGSLE